MELNKNTLIAVTGGASGLGRAVVERVVGQGACALILDRDAERGQQAAEVLGERVLFVQVDVTDADAVAAALDRGEAELAPLRGLVNCAGVGIAMKTLSSAGAHDLAAFKFVLEVNLVGSFNCLRLAAERIAKHEPLEGGERGAIVNTASIAAMDGQMGQAAYSASKGGIVGMTLPIARDLARFGIRVVTIAPGLFDTPLLAGLPEEARTSLGQQVPFPPRLGDPAEYGLLAEQILRNPMLNGETIRLDGALRMAPK